MSDAPAPEPPDALIEPAPVRRRLTSLVWLVPVAAVLLSVGFAVRALGDRGPRIVIRADHGHGIGAGDALRYLGIEVGRVEQVGLDDDGTGEAVRIEALMRADAAHLARAGTVFWVVRPQLSLDAVEGLETIIGAQYIALHPGPDGAPARTEFTALQAPPLADELRGEHGLEIVLEAPSRFGLQSGAPLTYRGVRVGTVTAVGLASDASSVEVRVRVRRAYALLVREGSVFWETGGVELGVSLTGGIDLDLDSLRTAFIGGVAMATPVDGGGAVSNGTRFTLSPDPADEWLEWAPALPVGNDLLPPGALLPKLLRATLSWTEGRVLKTEANRSGWMYVDADGLVGPRDLLTVPEDAREDRARLEVGGRTFDVDTLRSEGLVEEISSGLALLTLAALQDEWTDIRAAHEDELAAQRRPLLEPEDLIAVREGGRAPIAIAASRLAMEGDGMVVDPSIPLSPDWHGAVVMARSDGAVAGVLLVTKNQARVVPAR